MIRFIDNQLNRITMYRLVLYYLIWPVGRRHLHQHCHADF